MVWEVKERDPRSGLYLPRLRRHNVLTDTGLGAIAAGWTGQGTPPLWLVLDSYAALVQTATTVGSTSLTLDTDPTKAGDTQLIVGVGTANEETVTWSAKSGTGPYVFTTSATTKTHSHLDPVVRVPLHTDVLADIKSELQYDGAAAPGKRSKLSGTGFAAGAGAYTVQFFLTGSQAAGTWMSVGMADSDTVGAGLLHNHLAMGYAHPSGTDVELDVTLAITN